MGSIHQIERKHKQMDKLWKNSWPMISWIIKIIKSVRTLPTTKWISKDESYCLNMDLRKISQMQTPPMGPASFLTILIRACLDTTRSRMVSTALIWRTCRGRHKFKLRGMVLKIVILVELSRAPASATTNSKLKLALTVRHTKELPKAYQIIQAILEFFQSMALPDLDPFPILLLNNRTHLSKQLRWHWSKQTSQQW